MNTTNFVAQYNIRMPRTRIGDFALAMSKRRKELGLSLDEVAESLGTTYEYVRRLEKGMVFPSALRLRVLSELLNTDYEDLLFRVQVDQIRKKYGARFLARLTGKQPEIVVLEPFWNSLTEGQKDNLVMMAQAYSAQGTPVPKKRIPERS